MFLVHGYAYCLNLRYLDYVNICLNFSLPLLAIIFSMSSVNLVFTIELCQSCFVLLEIQCFIYLNPSTFGRILILFEEDNFRGIRFLFGILNSFTFLAFSHVSILLYVFLCLFFMSFS